MASASFLRHTRHQLPDMLKAAGSWRQLYVWRHMTLAPSSRLWIEAVAGASETAEGCTFTSLPVTLPDGLTPVTGQPATSVPGSGDLISGMNHHSTWSPCGSYVAYTLCSRSAGGILGSSVDVSVVIKDAVGRTCVSVPLPQPFPPFFYVWSPCGTRLALLSNWHHMRVALHVLEVPQARLIDPQYPHPEKFALTLLGLGTPLFFSWSRDSSKIVLATDADRCSVVDVNCALAMCRKEQVHPSALDMVLPERFVRQLRAPNWLRTPQGRSVLLLPETGASAPNTAEGNSVALVDVSDLEDAAVDQGEDVRWAQMLHDQVPEDELNAATDPHAARVWEYNQARQSDDESENFGRDTALVNQEIESGKLVFKVADSCLHDVAFVATRDASAIAWWNRQCHVHAVFATGDESATEPAYSRSYKVFPPEAAFPSDLPSEDGRWGNAVAMQWSPDGRRCLILLYEPRAPERQAGPALQCMRWVVWELAPSGTPLLTVCRQHHAPRDWVASHRSFFDSYAQSLTPWSPTSDAFCYTAVGHDDEDVVSTTGSRREFWVFVQPMPPSPQPSGAAALPSAENADMPIVRVAPEPVSIARGRSVSWSPS